MHCSWKLLRKTAKWSFENRLLWMQKVQISKEIFQWLLACLCEVKKSSIDWKIFWFIQRDESYLANKNQLIVNKMPKIQRKNLINCECDALKLQISAQKYFH